MWMDTNRRDGGFWKVGRRGGAFGEWRIVGQTYTKLDRILDKTHTSDDFVRAVSAFCQWWSISALSSIAIFFLEIISFNLNLNEYQHVHILVKLMNNFFIFLRAENRAQFKVIEQN